MVQQRFVLTGVLFMALGVNFTLRMIFPLILTQMVYVPNVPGSNGSSSSAPSGPNGELYCAIKNQPDETTKPIDSTGRYHWPQDLQGAILSSFHWGNLFSQIPGGILVQKYGGKMSFLVSGLASAIIVALIPASVQIAEAGGLIVTQVLLGLLQGPLIPAMSSFSAAWFPVEERSRTISIIFMGINTFGIFSTYLVGFTIDAFNRWDIAFYGYAVVAALTCVIFGVLCHEDPQRHPYISEKEKAYLKSKTASYLESERKNVPPTPWRAMLTSTPVLALFASLGFYMWAFTIVNLNFPKYINDVLHISLKKNTFYTTIPRYLNIFLSVFCGFMGDWLHSKRNVSLTTVRKIFAGLSSVIPAIFVIAASYAGCEEIAVVLLFSVATAGQGFDSAGTVCSAFDLAPNYIGPINAVAFTVSSAASILAPYAVGVLTPNAYLLEWRIVFWLTFIFFMAKAVIFSIWGSAKVQPWNSPERTTPNA